jgi:uncharacterized protein YcnI
VFALATAFATGAVLAAGTVTASAHICPVPAQIAIGQPATIDVGVTVENATVPDVEIDIPAGLQLDRVDAKEGWTFTRTGSTVRYHGGPIRAYQCQFFSLGVTAPTRGSWGIAVVQRTAAGVVVARSVPDPASSSDRVLDQFVYAGVKPPSPPGSGGPSAAILGGIAIVGVGVVMFAVLRIRAWRAGRADDDGADADAGSDDGARDADLQARLEQFRKRTPDPPSPR